MKEELAQLREQIDELDRQLVGLFEKRMSVCREIGRRKCAMGLPVEDPEREKDIIHARSQVLSDKKLIPYWTRLYKTLIDISKDYQWNSDADSLSRSR